MTSGGGVCKALLSEDSKRGLRSRVCVDADVLGSDPEPVKSVLAMDDVENVG